MNKIEPSLIFETWNIDRFIDYARNPRKNDHAVDQIAAAIKEFGFRVPVVAKSDGLVVDGHLRLKAAKKLGLSEIPVILADDLTDAQIKAFRLSVNKMAELADWDMELLKLELLELEDLDFDLELTGFSLDDFDFMLDEEENHIDINQLNTETTEELKKLSIQCREIDLIEVVNKITNLLAQYKGAKVAINEQV